MAFDGFSLPDGAWLPPELIYILPDIGTMSELKVTIVAIYETLRVGLVEAVISLGDFEVITGLDRKSVSRGIEAAIERGTFKRQKVGNTWLYRLNIQQTLPAATSGRGIMPLAAGGNGDENPSNRGTMPLDGRGIMPQGGVEMPQDGVEMPQGRGILPLDVVCCNTLPTKGSNKQQDNDKLRAALLAEMRRFGVKLAVAQKFLQKYDLEYLRVKLSQAMYAVEAGISTENGPGWFVKSVREDWQAPLGYYDSLKPKPGSREHRHRYVEGKYGHLIKH